MVGVHTLKKPRSSDGVQRYLHDLRQDALVSQLQAWSTRIRALITNVMGTYSYQSETIMAAGGG